jgi:hypothetical protein
MSYERVEESSWEHIVPTSQLFDAERVKRCKLHSFLDRSDE